MPCKGGILPVPVGIAVHAAVAGRIRLVGDGIGFHILIPADAVEYPLIVLFQRGGLNDLLNGRRTLTTVTAMMFEAALDIPADSLMRLQLKYNMQQAMSDRTLMERLNQIRKYAALL